MTMKRLVVFIILLITTANIFGQSENLTGQTDRVLFRIAEQRLQAQDFEIALQNYEKLIKQYPTSSYVADGYARMGMTLYSLGRYQEALPVFSLVENRYRSSAYVNQMPFWKGSTLYHLGQYQEALQSLGKLVGSPLNDLIVQGLMTKSLSHSALGQDAKAIEVLEQIIKPQGELLSDQVFQYPKVGFSLMTLNYEIGNTAKAGEIATVLLSQSTNSLGLSETQNRVVLFINGEAALVRGETDDARAIYEKLRTGGDGVSSLSYQRLFQIALETPSQEDEQRVIRLAESDLAGKPEVLVPFWSRVGAEEFSKGRLPVAELYLLKVWDSRAIVPLPPEAVLYLIEIELQQDNENAARGYIDTYLLSVNLPSPLILIRGSELALRSAEPQRALEFSSQALQQFQPENEDKPDWLPKAYYLNVASLYRLSLFDQAYTQLSRVLSQGYEGDYGPELLEIRGRIQRRRGDLSAAVASFRQYLLSRPDDAMVASAMMRSLLDQGEMSRAFEVGQAFLSRIGDKTTKITSYDRGLIEVLYQTGLAGLNIRNFSQARDLLAQLPDPKVLDGIPAWYRRLLPSVLYYRGWIAYQNTNDADAIRLFQAMLDVDTEHPQAQEAAYLSGWAAYRMKDWNSAAGFFEGTSLWVPDRGYAEEASFLYAKTLRARGDTSAALEVLDQIWNGRTGNSYRDDAIFEKAALLVEIGRVNEAAVAYKTLADEMPGSVLAPLGMFYRGKAFLDAENFTAARSAFQDFREYYPTHSWIDGALYFQGIASMGLDQNGAALLYWQRLIQEYRQSTYRFETMRQTAEVLESQGERRRALSLYNEMTTRYPNESKAEGIQTRLEQLSLVIAGLSEREASLWVEIENSEGVNSTRGRRAVLELGRLLIVEQTAGSVNRAGIVPLLQELFTMVDDYPIQAAEAGYLLAEYSVLLENLNQAALYFIGAAEASDNPDTQPVYYYRAIEVLRRLGRISDAVAIHSEMQNAYPRHELTTRADALIHEGQ